MSQEILSDAVLVLFGHGSTVNAKSSAPVFQHAAALRGRNLFKEVREAFWKQEPLLKDLVKIVSGPRVFLAPLFISEGYFSDQVIPKELGFERSGEADFQRMRQDGNRALFYCRAVGTHPHMRKVVLDRASEVISKFPFPRAPERSETTLFIAGHGTEQNENSRGAIDRQVERARAENVYAAVHGVFLDEHPGIGECYRLCETRNLVIVPFFISEGMHVQEDLPVLLGEPERVVRQRMAQGVASWRNPTERNGKLVWLGASVGTDPFLADVILERVREAASAAP